MYKISDVVEMGSAHEQILSLIKDVLIIDDDTPHSLSADDAFDE